MITVEVAHMSAVLKSLASVAKSAAKDKARPFLHGLHVERRGGSTLVWMASDGHRIHTVETYAEGLDSVGVWGGPRTVSPAAIVLIEAQIKNAKTAKLAQIEIDPGYFVRCSFPLDLGRLDGFKVASRGPSSRDVVTLFRVNPRYIAEAAECVAAIGGAVNVYTGGRGHGSHPDRVGRLRGRRVLPGCGACYADAGCQVIAAEGIGHYT